MCDKDCPLTCEEEELADIIIRVLDTSKARGIDIGKAVEMKMAYNSGRPFMHGKLA
jgi:NTP pyrophosphatase (non-canonical NTP hydrolase)